MCICLTVTTYAASANTYDFDYEDQGITVTFRGDCTHTEEEHRFIADALISGNETVPSSTYSWCWLLGHEYEYDQMVIVKHQVRETAPRCYASTIYITTCANCDLYEYSERENEYIYCCSEN